MLTFKKEHVRMIQRGEKTQTRRIRKNRDRPGVKKGGIHLAKTNRQSTEYFARLKIIEFHYERLGEISLEDVQREGYNTLKEFQQIWKFINKKWDPDQEVLVITFELYHDLQLGDKVRLSPECAEHGIHGDHPWTITFGPYYQGYHELCTIEVQGVKHYSAFSTDFLEKVEEI